MSADTGRRLAIRADVYGGPNTSDPLPTVAARRPSFEFDADLDQLPERVRRRREYREAGALGAELLGELTELVHGVHSAIAGRVFRYVGPPAAPVRVAHSAIADGVYGALRVGGGRLAKAAGLLLGRREAPPPSKTTAGSIVIGAVNGLLGGELDERTSPLAVRMGLWADGQEVLPTRPGLRRTYPDATPRLVVFAPGLGETEEAWRLHATDHYGDPKSTHGARLRRDLGYSPVYLRYNTGRHISDNGRQFSDLLERVVTNWPVPVREVVLVGHSMGGLVIRSACYAAEETGATWVGHVKHLVYLGSPHFGAPLAQLVHVGSWGLAKLPETAPVAGLLNRRSVGIRDLRYGTIVEADWKDLDPDALRGRRPSEIPLMPEATHYYVGATLTRDKKHPLGRVLGDALVQFPSASGRTKRRRLEFDLDNGRHIGGLNHMDSAEPSAGLRAHPYLVGRSAAGCRGGGRADRTVAGGGVRPPVRHRSQRAQPSGTAPSAMAEVTASCTSPASSSTAVTPT
jgi:pimeloyl-ACP methyl ester carboxylesterase